MTEIAALGLRVDGADGIEKSASALDHLTSSADSAEKATDRLNKESGKSKKALDDVAKSSEGASGSISSLAAAATRAGAIIGAAFSASALLRYADAWSDMTSLVRVNIGAQENAADVMNRLSDVARMTYSSMEATARSFATNAFTLNALGKTTQQQLDYTEALNNALVVSGAKGQQFEMVQNSLNRAMAEGSLRGTELQNVLNYGSRVAGLLAEELDVNVTELRALAAQGKITGEVIYNALTKNMEKVREEAESMPATVGDAFTLLRNAVLQTVGVFDQQNSISETLATTLISVADNMRSVVAILAGATAGWVTYQLAVNGVSIALGIATAAQRAFNVAAMANTYVAAATAIVAVGTALYGLRNQTIGTGEDTARVGDYMRATWDAVKDSVSGLTSFISTAWDSVNSELNRATGDMSISWSSVWNEMQLFAHGHVNNIIGFIASIAETSAIVGRAIVDAFRNAFSTALKLAEAFGKDLKRILSGDLSFSSFRTAIQNEIAIPTIKVSKDIRDAFKKNLGKDWLGDAISGVKDFASGISETAKASYRLNKDLDDLIANSGLFGGAVATAAVNVGTLNAGLKGTSDELQKILDKLYPLKAQTRALEAELNTLRRATAEGLIDPSVLDDWYEKNLMIAESIREEMVPAVEEMSAQADPLAESWQEALNRIDSAFVDLWKSAFNGFKDFADSLKNAFIQLLAELAHRATTQKILVSLGFTGASGGAMAGVAGGGGGLMGNIFSAGSWISAGKTLWQGFSGLATGQGLSGFAGLFGRFGADAAFESAALKGGLEAAWAQADAAASMSKFANTVGPILAGIGGAIQGWMSGNKANTITGAIGGWGGAKAGAAAGTYFMPGIGTAIGAVLGGILGSSLGSSVFGGAWENRRSGIRLGFDEEGLNLEDWIRQTKKGGWFSSTKRRYIYSEMEDALADEFRTGYDAMIDVLGAQFLAIGADLDRAVFEAVRIGAASINTSDQTEEEVQAQIEEWFNDLQAAMIQGALNAAGDTSAAVRLLRATGGDAAMLEALGGLMVVAGINAVQQARDAQTQLTMVESYRAVTEATRTLISEYDGSLEATLGLTEAMAVQQELAHGLATAYLQASDAVGALFGNLKESIRTSLMGAEELYEYQRSQVHNLTDLLGTLTDPEAILRTSQEIERLVSGMWSRLDEGQRSTLGDEFLDYLDRTEALAQDRLAKGLAELESTQADIYSALTSQMNDVADRMIETADRMQAAADLQWQSSMQFGAYVQQMGVIMSGANQGREQNA